MGECGDQEGAVGSILWAVTKVRVDICLAQTGHDQGDHFECAGFCVGISPGRRPV